MAVGDELNPPTTGSTFHRPVIVPTPETTPDDPLATDLVTLDQDLVTYTYAEGARRPTLKLVGKAGTTVTRAQLEAWGGEREGILVEGDSDEDIGEGE